MVNIRFKTGDFKHIHGGKMKLWTAPNSKYTDNELFPLSGIWYIISEMGGGSCYQSRSLNFELWVMSSYVEFLNKEEIMNAYSHAFALENGYLSQVYRIPMELIHGWQAKKSTFPPPPPTQVYLEIMRTTNIKQTMRNSSWWLRRC